MADGGPIDAGERGTSPADRGTSVTPRRNASRDGVERPDAGRPANVPDVSIPDSDAPDDIASGTLPKLAPDFAAKFETLKTEYADEEAAEYASSLTNPDPKQLATAKAIGDKVRSKIATELANLSPYDLIGPATTLANQWINTTLAELAKRQPNVSDCLTAAFAKHFAAETEEQISAATTALVTRLTSLRDDDAGLNSSTPAYSYDGVWCRGAAAGYTFTSSGSVLCPSMLKSAFGEYRAKPRSYRTLSMTLMHEGLHRVATLFFHHIGSETYADMAEYKELDLAGHLKEIDSYVHFARDVADCVGS